MLKRLAYLPYYALNTSLKEIIQLVRFVKAEKKIPVARIWSDVLLCSLRYNMSFMDYFSLRFYVLSERERGEYIGSGAMYEYQLIMNPKKHRKVLADKIEFLNTFNDLAGRKWASIQTIQNETALVSEFLNNPSGRVVLKNSKGQAGRQVEVCTTSFLDKHSLIRKMKKSGFNLIETYLVQNDVLMEVSPSALNTLRLVTQVTNGDVIILTARLRVSINAEIDNVAAGNIAMPVDISTGKVCGPGIYADITKKDEYAHPVTGIDFIGFTIPFWKECLQLVILAAKRIPQNRSVGWDVAVTNEGPVLIEGNHNWHYLMWQMPERRGFKKEYVQYLRENKKG